MGARQVKAELAASGGALSGSFTGEQGTVPVSGTVDGNAVAFAATVTGPMGQLELKFSGALDGDSMAGTVQFGAFGSGTFTGSKG